MAVGLYIHTYLPHLVLSVHAVYGPRRTEAKIASKRRFYDGLHERVHVLRVKMHGFELATTSY